MCTVTFIPLGSGDFALTSNRDVSYRRPKASPPQIHVDHGVSLLYPKDGKAGGTWIGSSRDNRLICLLNGGFDNHQRQPEYRKSRGLIVTELLAADDLSERLRKIDLNDIEPFTLVLVEWVSDLQLGQFVWDGHAKHLKRLPLSPTIWSSSTLFDKSMREIRKDWFGSWIREHELSPEAVLRFHKEAGAGDDMVGVVLRRKQVGTVSITQFVRREGLYVHYEALVSDQKGEEGNDDSPDRGQDHE